MIEHRVRVMMTCQRNCLRSPFVGDMLELIGDKLKSFIPRNLFELTTLTLGISTKERVG